MAQDMTGDVAQALSPVNYSTPHSAFAAGAAEAKQAARRLPQPRRLCYMARRTSQSLAVTPKSLRNRCAG